MPSQPVEKVRLFHRSHGSLQPDMQPIVIERKHTKSKDNDHKDEVEYTPGFKDVQQFEGDVLRVAQRGARALSKGIDTYEHERQKSAKEKKDGAIEDFVHNSAKATSAYVKEISDVPLDIADSLERVSYRKLLRQNLRRTSRIIRLFRI